MLQKRILYILKVNVTESLEDQFSSKNKKKHFILF